MQTDFSITQNSILFELEKLGLKAPLYFFKETDSTNTRAEEILKTADAPFIAFALKQTAGRGRFGRTWFDEAGSSISLSVGFPLKKIPHKNLEIFTLFCAIKICKALRTYTALDLQIKWPNDIYLNGKKLAGMLANVSAKGGVLESLIFGIGLKFKPLKGGEFSEFESLGLSENALDFSETVALVANAIFSAFEDLCRDSLENFVSDFASLDFLSQKQVSVKFYEKIVEGIACGIDSCGSLILRLPSGNNFLVSAGESSIVKK